MFYNMKDSSYIDDYEFNINDSPVIQENFLLFAKEVYDTIKLSIKYMLFKIFSKRDPTKFDETIKERTPIYNILERSTPEDQVLITINLMDIVLRHFDKRKSMDNEMKVDPRIFNIILRIRKTYKNYGHLILKQMTKTALSSISSKEAFVKRLFIESFILSSVTISSLIISSYFSTRRLIINKWVYKNMEEFSENLYRAPTQADINSIVESPHFTTLTAFMDTIESNKIDLSKLNESSMFPIEFYANPNKFFDNHSELSEKKTLNESLTLGLFLASLGIGGAAVIAIAYLTDVIVSTFFAFRVNLSKYLEQQAKFLELNALQLELERPDLSKEEIDRIANTQRGCASRLLKIADIVRVENAKVTKAVSDTLKKDKAEESNDSDLPSRKTPSDNDDIFF